ncbi:MAG: AI-2E family transporter [Patescibacteria group bacterium]
MQDKTIHISVRTIFIFLGSLAVFYLLFRIKDIAISLFLSLIIMSAMNPGVNKLEQKKIPRPIGIAFLYLCVFGVLFLMFTLIVPPLAKELSMMVKYLQPANLPKELVEFKFTIQDLGSILGQVGTSLNSVISVITTTFSSIFFLFTLLVMSFYLLMARKTLHRQFFWLPHSKKFEELSEEFVDTVEVQLGGWVRGELVLMFSIGIATFVVLTLLAIPYALPLAVLAGFLELLPNIGPTISAIPAILIAFILVSPTMAVIVLAMYVIIQQIENNVLVPKIMKAAVNIEPLTSIIMILIGVKLAGAAGALLAIPLYITVRSVVQIYLRETHR